MAFILNSYLSPSDVLTFMYMFLTHLRQYAKGISQYEKDRDFGIVFKIVSQYAIVHAQWESTKAEDSEDACKVFENDLVSWRALTCRAENRGLVELVRCTTTSVPSMRGFEWSFSTQRRLYSRSRNTLSDETTRELIYCAGKTELAPPTQMRADLANFIVDGKSLAIPLAQESDSSSNSDCDEKLLVY